MYIVQITPQRMVVDSFSSICLFFF